MPKSLAEYLAEVRRAIPSRAPTESPAEAPTAPVRGPDLATYRPITAPERDFLAYLLHYAEPDATAFLPQLEGMRVLADCNCGCPSIALGVSLGATPVKYPNRMIAEMSGYSSGKLVGVILWRVGGELAELEVYALDDITGPFGLPALDTLKPIGWQPQR